MTVLTLITWCRDEFIPPGTPRYHGWQLWQLLPHWPTLFWVAVFVLLIGLSAFEIAFQQHKDSGAEATEKRPTLYLASGNAYSKPTASVTWRAQTGHGWLSLILAVLFSFVVLFFWVRSVREVNPEKTATMAIIPTDEGQKTTQMMMQLIPAVYDGYPRAPVTALLVSFDNAGSADEQDISLRVYVPPLKTAKCPQPDRIQIIDGASRGSTVVHFFARQLRPNEKHSCRIELMQGVAVGDADSWTAEYGVPSASRGYNRVELFIYRVKFGPIEIHPEAPRLFSRAITINPLN